MCKLTKPHRRSILDFLKKKICGLLLSQGGKCIIIVLPFLGEREKKILLHHFMQYAHLYP
jgi:hypothetical protein